MYAEIVAAVQSAKTLAELLKAAHGLSNHVEIVAAVNAVQDKLTVAYAANLESAEKQAALAERVRELEKQIAEVENWASQMQRYVLFKFPTGALAYAVKPGMEQGEPTHYLCASCVDKKQRSTLQPNGRSLRCTVCKIDFAIQEIQHPAPSNHGGGPQSWMGR